MNTKVCALYNPSQFPTIQEIISLYFYYDKLLIIPPINFIFKDIDGIQEVGSDECLDAIAVAYEMAVKFEKSFNSLHPLGFVSRYPKKGYRFMSRISYMKWDQKARNLSNKLIEQIIEVAGITLHNLNGFDFEKFLLESDHFPINFRTIQTADAYNINSLLGFCSTDFSYFLSKMKRISVFQKVCDESKIKSDLVAYNILKKGLPTFTLIDDSSLTKNIDKIIELKKEFQPALTSLKTFINQKIVDIIKRNNSLSEIQGIESPVTLQDIINEISDDLDKMNDDFLNKLDDIHNKKDEIKYKFALTFIGGIALGFVTNPFVSIITSLVSLGNYSQEKITQLQNEENLKSSTQKNQIGINILFKEINQVIC